MVKQLLEQLTRLGATECENLLGIVTNPVVLKGQ